MTPEQLSKMEEQIKEIVGFAKRIMEGEAEYDGADGAREVIKLDKLYSNLLTSQQHDHEILVNTIIENKNKEIQEVREKTANGILKMFRLSEVRYSCEPKFYNVMAQLFYQIMKKYKLSQQVDEQEIKKAFGGCEKCYGKGYSTAMLGEEGMDDFANEGYKVKPHPQMIFCNCDRGKQLKGFMDKNEQEIKKEALKGFLTWASKYAEPQMEVGESGHKIGWVGTKAVSSAIQAYFSYLSQQPDQEEVGSNE